MIRYNRGRKGVGLYHEGASACSCHGTTCAHVIQLGATAPCLMPGNVPCALMICGDNQEALVQQ
eukprot:4457783-Amphidinium_carterae.1